MRKLIALLLVIALSNCDLYGGGFVELKLTTLWPDRVGKICDGKIDFNYPKWVSPTTGGLYLEGAITFSIAVEPSGRIAQVDLDSVCVRTEHTMDSLYTDVIMPIEKALCGCYIDKFDGGETGLVYRLVTFDFKTNPSQPTANHSR